MAPPRKSARLAYELAEDPATRFGERHINFNVLRRLCRHADEKATCGDLDSLRIARLCCRIAGQLGTDEARSLGFAQLATALWLGNRLKHAWRALEIGLARATGSVHGDLIRRRSFLHLYQGQITEALYDAKTALELTEGQEHALAREMYGIALYYRGNYPAAIRELAIGLEKTDPSATILFGIAIQNYATALAQGTDADITEALRLCTELRARLKERHKMQRAKLWWTEGLIHERLGDPKAAWAALDIARRSLIALEAAPELGAIVADMARVAPQPLAVGCLCAEAAKILAAPHPLAAPLEALANAAEARIPRSAVALHNAASALAPGLALAG